jgi:hypothetical protein
MRGEATQILAKSRAQFGHISEADAQKEMHFRVDRYRDGAEVLPSQCEFAEFSQNAGVAGNRGAGDALWTIREHWKEFGNFPRFPPQQDVDK